MDYRRLGRTDLRVSAICLGTMTFGEQTDADDAHRQLDMALDQGVNFIDTAEMYAVPARQETQGRSEEIVGDWLAARGVRDRIVLASKVSGRGDRFPYIRPHLHNGTTRLDRQSITEAVEGSLSRLKTDYIDLYQLHWPDRRIQVFGARTYEHVEDTEAVPILEQLRVLQDLVAQGKVRHIGLSNETPWGVMEFLRLADAHGLPRVVSVQNAYNLLCRTFEPGLAEIAMREDCGLLAYSPLAGGVLTGKYLGDARPSGARLTLFGEYFGRYTRPRGIEATAAYVRLAERHEIAPLALALAFTLSRPFVTASIVGATTAAQLAADLALAKTRLSDDIVAEVNAIHADITNPAH